MVYVPPHGSTRKGAKINVDFFILESKVLQCARKLRHLDDGFEVSNLEGSNHNEEVNETCEPECSFFENLQLDSNNDGNDNTDNSMVSQRSEDGNCYKDKESGDSLLHGGFFTLNSLRQCARVMKTFCNQQDSDKKHFKSQLWIPIWEILNSQGGYDKNLNWTYLKSSGLMASSGWVFGTPNTRGARFGDVGIDYFLTEESVVAYMLEDIAKLHPPPLDAVSLDKISKLCPPSTYANDEKNAASSRTRRKRQPSLENGVVEDAVVGDRSMKRARPRKDVEEENSISETDNQKPAASNVTISLSQSAVAGVQMLLEMSKADVANTPTGTEKGEEKNLKVAAKGNPSVHAASNELTPNPDVGTDNGPLNLVAYRTDRSCDQGEKSLHPKNAELNSTESTISKTPTLPLHISQSPSASLNGRKELIVKHRKHCDILKGFSFLLSGCAHVSDQVTRMGGNVVENVAEISLTRNEVGGKLWFLSEPSCRRRTKYLLAVALGLPMLHYHCLNDLEHGKFLSLFDNELYKIWRLPTGLSIFSGLFILQRARHACAWAPPGFEDGQVIFQDMTLMLALEDEILTKDWLVFFPLKKILQYAGIC